MVNTTMIEVAGPHLAVIDSEWTGDAQHAGHYQGALDPGGDAREGLPVHAARVPKAPTDRGDPAPGGRAGRLAARRAGGCCPAGPSRARSDVPVGQIWPRAAVCPPPGLRSKLHGTPGNQIEGVGPVSRLSATIRCAASRRTTAHPPARFLISAYAVPSRAAEGLVSWCGWHGMQAVTALEVTLTCCCQPPRGLTSIGCHAGSSRLIATAAPSGTGR